MAEREKNVVTRDYPLVTDLEGLKLIDRKAYDSLMKGWNAEVKRHEEKDDGSKPSCDPTKMRFALTQNKGWDTQNEEGACFGYNPVQDYWTFYEYDEFDAYDIFGRAPRESGFNPEYPIVEFEFPDVEEEQVELDDSEKEIVIEALRHMPATDDISLGDICDVLSKLEIGWEL